MRTRRGSKDGAADGVQANQSRQTVRGPKGGARKKRGAAATKSGKLATATLTKRVTLRGGRAASSRGAKPAHPLATAPPAQQQQPQGSAASAAAAQRKRRGSQLAFQKNSPPTIEGLATESLQEIFLLLSSEDGEQQSYCREVLPLVCKRFRDVLRLPSVVWETLHVDFTQKDHVLVTSDCDVEGVSVNEPPDASCRRLLHSAVERWIEPRADAVKRLILSFSARDTTHSFSKAGHGLRKLFSLVGPNLQELYIAHCSDIFHAASFTHLPLLTNLESLAVTFMKGAVPPANLEPLQRLPKLRSLTLSACAHEENTGDSIMFEQFPEALCKLKGLTSLALCTRGVTLLPASLTKLRLLANLDVSGCALTKLPLRLPSALRHLRLNDTALDVKETETWDPLAKLPALELLELRDSGAKSLPVRLASLRALTSLDLSNNSFDVLNDQEEGLAGLGGLLKLQRLLLRCCQLPSVPPEMGSLSRLTHLDISRNQLVELPPGMSAMLALKELVAEGNCFPHIPQVLSKLPALEVADLSFNIYMEAAASLHSLLEDSGFSKLQRLDLRKMLGVWKKSSTRWLQELVQQLEQRREASRHACPVVLWD